MICEYFDKMTQFYTFSAVSAKKYHDIKMASHEQKAVVWKLIELKRIRRGSFLRYSGQCSCMETGLNNQITAMFIIIEVNIHFRNP